jgi:type I restriction enzyme M protein
MSRISQQQLESHLWGAAVLLRGTIDAGDYKQFIFPLLFFKRLCDVYDEETMIALRDSGGDQDFALFPENHRFQIPPEAHWREIRKAGRDVGRALQSAMRLIETKNQSKLMGIFGDAQWTNKDRLSDAMLRDLIEHFSSLELTVANLPEDELGQGYEYLIKKFADDSGHTAAEFYTNRTVVHLMTEMLDVQPGESVYDPTCGSGGMLLSCITHLRNHGKEWRNVKLYGQERNLMTSSIARMNCFLHGIEDFRIERGDTLAEPKLVEGDRLQRFDVVLANPPYSIKQWDRDAFASDPWGRNVFGVPPQGRADYAFQQHILQSLKPKTGRCAVLWPHGVLFRQEEADMRRKLIEADLIECVVGLGPNLFYNSAMDSCVVICRTQKPKDRRGRILLIDARSEVARERNQSFLTDDHIGRIVRSYVEFSSEPGFSSIPNLSDIRSRDYNLNIALYISNAPSSGPQSTDLLESANILFRNLLDASTQLYLAMETILTTKAKSAVACDNPTLSLPTWLNRTQWRKVRLGEVVRQIRDRVDDASAAGISHYLPGGGINASNFRIKEWKPVDDGVMGPAFHMRLKPGHVLYKSRVPHGVGVADRNGICANTTYVLEAMPEILDQRLLPFLLVTKAFRQFETDNNRGSTNLFLNYSDIAKFEFSLPPLDQQRRIAEILWALDELNAVSIEQIRALKIYQRSVWDAHIAEKDVKTVRIGDIAVVANGSTPSKAEDRYWVGGTFPWLPTGKVHERFIRTGGEFITEAALKERKARVFPSGSVLVAMIGQGKTRGSAALLEIDASVNQNFACVIPRDIDSHYLFYALDFSYEALRRSSHGSNQEALNCGLVANFRVPCPPRVRQEEIAAAMKDCENAQNALQQYYSNSTILLTELINTMFPA